MDPDGRVSMVVLEQGGDWAGWAEAFRDGMATRDVIVLAQDTNESATEFALRVRGRLAELSRGGSHLASAVVVGPGQREHPSTSARELAVGAIIASMARTGGGHIMLRGGRCPDTLGPLQMRTDLLPPAGVIITQFDAEGSVSDVA